MNQPTNPSTMTSLVSSDQQYQQQPFQRHKRRSRRALPFKVPAMPLPPKDLLQNNNSDSLSTSTSPTAALTDESELGTSLGASLGTSLGISLNSYRPENSVSVLDIAQEDLIDICTTTTTDVVVDNLDEDHSTSIPIIEDIGDEDVDVAYVLVGDNINNGEQEEQQQEQEQLTTGEQQEQREQEPKKEVVVVVSTHIIEDRLETFSNNMKYIAKSALLQAGGATAAFAMMNNDYYDDDEDDDDQLLVIEEEYEDFVGQHPILDYHRHLNQPIPVGQPQPQPQPQPPRPQHQQPQPQQQPKQSFVRKEQRRQEATDNTVTGFLQARASRFSRNCVTLGNIISGK